MDESGIKVTVTADTQRAVGNENSLRRLDVSLKALRETIKTLSPKKILILSDWLVKWATLLKDEINFSPRNYKKYKQREIILVDFGFNIDGEFGGRHYAVVLDKNNNPASQVIMVAPITSYDPDNGERPHATNIDLGIGFIHNTPKGAAIVINQIRTISKMRIEKPLSSHESRIYIDKEKFNELKARITQIIL